MPVCVRVPLALAAASVDRLVASDRVVKGTPSPILRDFASAPKIPTNKTLFTYMSNPPFSGFPRFSRGTPKSERVDAPKARVCFLGRGRWGFEPSIGGFRIIFWPRGESSHQRRNRKPVRPRLTGEAEDPQSVRPPGPESYPEPCPREKGTDGGVYENAECGFGGGCLESHDLWDGWDV